ncbi:MULTISPECIES: hypothetical protein [unclassified Caballeronia]|uniref:hypothetical protein n=1 Tax=unclassified Caballeronia TaxID=2646786 RepID=UPI002028B2B4|nr:MULTISPECIES: hypothetical protein [unclassified Caballeronia]MDR5802716.1 hypothetical protein [Caballeronia sp. LZ001]
MIAVGTGLFTMWNDIPPAYGREFALMHTRDHVPEHMAYLGDDGIRWARRCIDGQGDMPRFFTFYGLTSLDVLTDEKHAKCKVTETAWFLKMRPHYRDRIAYHCSVLASAGGGTGGTVATLLIDFADDARQDAPRLAALVDDLTRLSPVVGAHLAAPEWNVPIRVGEALPAGREGNEAVGVVILEGFDRYELAACLEDVREQLVASGVAGRVRSAGHYAQAYRLDYDELAHLEHFRRDDALITERFDLK